MERQVVYNFFVAPDGRKVTRTSWVDDDLRYHWICQKEGDGNPLVVGVQQGYLVHELEAMLHDAGFNSFMLYGNYQLSPVSLDRKRLIVRATT